MRYVSPLLPRVVVTGLWNQLLNLLDPAMIVLVKAQKAHYWLG